MERRGRTPQRRTASRSAQAAEAVIRAANSPAARAVAKAIVGAGKRYFSRSKSAPKAIGTETVSGQSGKKITLYKKSRAKRAKSAPLKKRVTILEKKLKDETSTHTYKFGSTLALSSSLGFMGLAYTGLCNAGTFEAVLANMPRVNTALPGTATTWDATTLKQPATWPMNGFWKVMIRNNYLFPCNIRMYIIKPKEDHDVAPDQAVIGANGYSKEATPSISNVNDPWFYPCDSKEFCDLWTIIETSQVQLQSGDETEYFYKEKFIYDQEILDNNARTYLKKYARYVLFRIQGVICHDSLVVSTISFSSAKADVITYGKLTVQHTTDAPFRTIHEVSGISTSVTGTQIVGVESAEVETAP